MAVLLSNEEGKCPYCGSKNLSVDVFELQDESGYFNVTCNECEKDFKAWYDLKFAGMWGDKIKKKKFTKRKE